MCDFRYALSMCDFSPVHMTNDSPINALSPPSSIQISSRALLQPNLISKVKHHHLTLTCQTNLLFDLSARARLTAA